MVVSLSGKRGVLFRKRNVSPSGVCAHSGRGFFPFRKRDAPPISFSPCRRKRNAHLCAKSRPPGGCAPKRRCGGRRLGLDALPSLLLNCTPLFFFSVCGEKEECRARWRRKRGALGSRLGGSRPSILLRRRLNHGTVWCPVVTLPLLLTALRAGAGRSVSCVQIRAEMTLRCAAGRACADVVLENCAARNTFYFVGQWCRFTKGRVRKSGNIVHPLPLPLRGVLGCCKGCKMLISIL